MNRFKQEEARKHRQARAGLSEQEIKQLDHEDAIQTEIEQLARKIHAEKFPEEYDFIFDDHVDYTNRRKGVNPMSDDYIINVANKREEQGVSPLSDSGDSTSRDTWDIARAEAEARVRG